MKPEIFGAIVGALIGFVDYIALRFVKEKVKQKGLAQGADRAELARMDQLFNLMAIGSLILFPIAGYFMGPLFIGEGG